MVDVVKISEYLNPRPDQAVEADDIFYIAVADGDLTVLARYENRIIECKAVDDLDPTAVVQEEKPAVDLINARINESDSAWRERCERGEDLDVKLEIFLHVACAWTDNVQPPRLLS